MTESLAGISLCLLCGKAVLPSDDSISMSVSGADPMYAYLLCRVHTSCLSMGHGALNPVLDVEDNCIKFYLKFCTHNSYGHSDGVEDVG